MSNIFVTVDFSDELHSVTRPVASLQAAINLVNNEAAFDNTLQAYAWGPGGLIHYCQHGQPSPLYREGYLNINALHGDDI
jgi:hypothetical protein